MIVLDFKEKWLFHYNLICEQLTKETESIINLGINKVVNYYHLVNTYLHFSTKEK